MVWNGNLQLPLAPPVFTGFFTGPAALEVDLAMNLEPACVFCLEFLLPALFFLSLIWNPIFRSFFECTEFKDMVPQSGD